MSKFIETLAFDMISQVDETLKDAELELRLHQLSEPVNIKKLFKRIGIDYEKVMELHRWREEIEQP